MQIIPAIDIRNGKCVRLVQGDYSRQISYENDPVSQAMFFEDCGANIIHVVDLDGAKEGHPENSDLVCKIRSKVNVEVEIGGGIRTEDDIRLYAESGINRIIIGTKILNPDFSETISKYKDFIVAGIDAKDGKVATHGWVNVSEYKALDVIRNLCSQGVNRIIFTDIATDGMMQGPNYESLKQILDNIPGVALVASGGVSSVDDVKKLKMLEKNGLFGCIIGKAIYDGMIDLKEAVRTANG
ncbi:MAG: 1-(5-phosphoribosyl)-5-[(5-phosphoribosylamino)methylideneamino]imidazole-4-carboxamide isomerase [Spirochaetes bacterium]|nr:1-(5-phosphoribosyl)-5-[(5-phosphoribosylamino)methylideneamino]imidazole-4-carboxamide isomerase [Spirochaetota bacterium]